MNDNINQNNDCGNARDCNFNSSACDDAEYVWVARPMDCRPADTVDNINAKDAAEENARDGANAAEYSDAGKADFSAVDKNTPDCANAVDNADAPSVADNSNGKVDGCSAAEKKSSVDGGTDCESERKACFSLRDKLFDELDLMFAARSDNARKLVMPAELEEISDTGTLIDRFLLRPHSHRCGELLTSLTKAFFAEAVAVMIIDEASAESHADSAKQ